MSSTNDFEGDGMVYDIPYIDPQYINKQFDQCVVHIRPLDSWRGEDFGFDWIRIGDTKLKGDIKYYNKIGRYYDEKGIRIDNSDKYLNSQSKKLDFKPDPDLYKKLIREYFPISYPITWKREKISSSDSPVRKNEKQAKFTYYVPVMSLGINKTANLCLKVEMAGKKEIYPVRITVEPQDKSGSFFTFTGEVINSPGNNKKYNCSITCNKTFSMDQYIDIIAEYDDGEKRLCGQLRVMSNYRSQKPIDILCVNVVTVGKSGEKKGAFSLSDREPIEKIFNQALINCNFINDDTTNDYFKLEININRQIVNPNNSSEAGMLKHSMRGDVFFRTSGTLHLCLFAFEEMLVDRLKLQIKNEIKNKYQYDLDNAITQFHKKDLEKKIADEIEERINLELKTNHPMRQYDNCYKIFFLGNKFEYVKKTTDGDMEYTNTTKTKGYAIKELRSAVLYANRDTETTAHELLHAVGLDHSFAPVTCAAEALFTYSAEETDNIMDYSPTRYNTWYWQWKRLWQIFFYRTYILIRMRNIKSVLLLLAVLLLSNCSSTKQTKLFIMETNQLKKNLYTDSINIAEYNKNRKGRSWEYMKGEYAVDLAYSDTRWQVPDEEPRYYMEITPPKPYFYKIVQIFYNSGRIKKRGMLIDSIDVGVWEYYDTEGNKTEINEDDKYGKFTYNDVLLFMHNKKLINVYTGENRERLSLFYDEENKVWNVSLTSYQEHRDWHSYTLDGDTGKVLDHYTYIN